MSRHLDEQARRQREREEAAEAKLAARKAGFGAAPERPISRDQPEASGGAPRLNLSGTRPSWREREAARASGQAPPAPAAAPAAAEAEPPKRTGYVPPALRNRDGASPAGGWREREGSGRGVAGRNESPAASSGRYEPPARGRFSDLGDGPRTQSPASGGGYVPPARRGTPQDGPRGRESEREPLPPAQGASEGKYRPGAFRRAQQG